MSDGGWPFGGWIFLESDPVAPWPRRSYKAGTAPWDEVPLFEPLPWPPDSDRAGWIAAEIEHAESRLRTWRCIAGNDCRQLCCNRRDVKAAERVSGENSRRIVRYERYIAALKERLRAAAH